MGIKLSINNISKSANSKIENRFKLQKTSSKENLQLIPMIDKKQRDENMGSGDSFFRRTVQQAIAKGNKQPDYKQGIKKVLISIPYQIAITLLTVYSLVGDDIRTVAFSKNEDMAFDGIDIALMIIFGLEIILSSIVLDNYFLSFFFFLDIISSASLILDISMFTEVIFLSSSTNNYSFSKMATQSKASRAAIRAVRVVKLFRIIRIVKLYKSALKAEEINEGLIKEKAMKQRLRVKFEKNHKDQLIEDDSMHKVLPLQIYEKVQILPKLITNAKKISPQQIISPINNFQDPTAKLQLNEDCIKEQPIQRKLSQQQVNQLMDTQILQQVDKKESKIRKILGDITLKKIIIVVLMLMFIVPLFDTQIYTDQANSIEFTMNSLKNLLLTPSTTVPTSQLITLINQLLNDMKNDDYNLLYFSSPFTELPIYKHNGFYQMRIADLVTASVIIDTTVILTARPDLTLRTDLADDTEKTSLLCMLNQQSFNIYQGYLSLGRTFFICCLLILVLYFFNKDIEDLIVKPIEEMILKLKTMAENPQAAAKEQINPNAKYQTTIVSNAIVKIGTLLSIVFGSAGAQIIGKNMVQQGDMNPMLQGRKKCAIFGFCDIRKFTQINQILQQDILKFVNKISSIVHKAVYRYGGSANKNIGEAFLLVWKLPQKHYTISNNNEIQWHNRSYLSILADFSVYSFIKILVKINKSPEILEYRNDYRLLDKIPNYKVEMGFGLHIGWAIEGAIGSEYKIDASYLSPNVNMASRLEAATKQFGVNLLISQSLHDLMTPGLQSYCRNIDRVTVKGSNKPLKLYTIDMNLQNITAPADKMLKYPNIPDYEPDIELKRDINLQFLQPQEIKGYNADNFIKSKKQLRQVMVNAVPFDFRMRFDEGVKCYLAGKWSDAKLHFTHAEKIRSSDGPTKKLLSYMKNFEFLAPPTWNNFRELTSK